MVLLGGIVPFLIQWLALSSLGNIGFRGPPDAFSPSGYSSPSSSAPHSYSTLLNDFRQLPEDEIETFLPQICNLLVESEMSSSYDPETYAHFQDILVNKCNGCLPFGIRLSSMLKACMQPTTESIFKQPFGYLMNMGIGGSSQNSADKERERRTREEQIRILYEHAESSVLHGYKLPERVSHLRAIYARDMMFMLNTFARLGDELKLYPVPERNFHLRRAVRQLNHILYMRMSRKEQHEGMAASVGPDSFPYGQNMDQNLAQGQHGQRGTGRSEYNDNDTDTDKEYNQYNQYNNEHVNEEKERQHNKQNTPISFRSPSDTDTCTDTGTDTCSDTGTFGSSSTSSKSKQTQTNLHNIGNGGGRDRDRDRDRQIQTAAAYSVHVPLQHCGERVLRILRFVEEECEVLPSKDRCPYLLLAEVVEQEFQCKNHELYSQRHILGVTIEDVLYGRTDGPVSLADISSEEDDNDNDNDNTHAHPPVNVNVDIFARPRPPSILRHGPVVGPVVGERGGNNNGNTGNTGNTGNIDPFQSQQYQPSPTPTPTHSQNYYHDQYTPTFPQQQHDQNHYQPNQNSVNDDVTNNGNYGNINIQQRQQQGQQQQKHSNPYNPPPHPYNSNPHARGPFSGLSNWNEKVRSIKENSQYGNVPGWKLKSFIVKSGDDLRKELLAMQVIELFQNIFIQEDLDIFVKPYKIVPISDSAGLVEFLEGAHSIDRIKKSGAASGSSSSSSSSSSSFSPSPFINSNSNGNGNGNSNSNSNANGNSNFTPTLRRFFEHQFGEAYTFTHAHAVDNFVKSLVGYSLLTYCLQVKDRHNANILLDSDGHIIHIDYGFILGDSPGMNINFENAPFKLTKEYVEVLGGLDSEAMKTFQRLFIKGFFALQKHVEAIATIVKLFYGEKRKNAADDVRSRLLFARTESDVYALIRDSLDNWRTKQYDWFQQRTNDILP